MDARQIYLKLVHANTTEVDQKQSYKSFTTYCLVCCQMLLFADICLFPFRYHSLYPDLVPDLRDSEVLIKRYFFYGFHASAFRG